jgi:hypothetical protein
MAVQQVASSYQNDGNFAQIDLQDVTAQGPEIRCQRKSEEPAETPPFAWPTK